MSYVGGDLTNWLGNLSVILGGVFGGAIGFVFLVLAGAILAIPYVLMTRRRSTVGRRDKIPS